MRFQPSRECAAYGDAMSDDDDFVAYKRILSLVSDAEIAAVQGMDIQSAAKWIVANRMPLVEEIDAARRENQSAHGGGMPDILRGVVKPPPFSEDEARMRRIIDDTLVAARSLVQPSN